jgi:hypothetical protein
MKTRRRRNQSGDAAGLGFPPFPPPDIGSEFGMGALAGLHAMPGADEGVNVFAASGPRVPMKHCATIRARRRSSSWLPVGIVVSVPDHDFSLRLTALSRYHEGV